MTKFCIKCGKELNENEVCNCYENVQNNNFTNSSFTNSVKNINMGAIQDIEWKVIINQVLKNPIYFSKELSKKLLLTHLFIISFVNVLFASLYVLILSNRIIEQIFQYIGGSMGEFAYEFYSEDINDKVSYGEIFLKCLGVFIISYIILVLLQFGIYKVFLKKDITLFDSFMIMSINSLVPSVIILLAMIFATFMPTISIFIAIGAFLVFVIFNFMNSKEILGIEYNKLIYFIPILYTSNFIVLNILSLLAS
jgi:hypothetical protein